VAANIPITFELTVLLAALSCFFGMLVLNRLPLPSHPLDHSRRFARATDDHFFLLIQASDPKFDLEQTQALLAGTGALNVEHLPEDTKSSNSLPRGFVFTLLIAGSAALVPFALAALARESTTQTPRFDIVPDMDFQTKFKAQRANPFFPDGRSMREPVSGTVAVGQLRDDDGLYRGKTPEGAWLRTFPPQITINDATMQRGKQRFGIYCTPCHGEGGLGNGMVNQRALGLAEGTWVPPANLTDTRLIYSPVGELFNTISNGVRNMPSYAKQIKPEDRWAVILYIRALQRSEATTLKDVPKAARGALK
jgi:mono/diheme cytochrome c family protein